MNLGFHTISLPLHDELTAINELAKLGYRTVGVKPRLSGLDPTQSDFHTRLLQLTDAARRLSVELVFDLDAQYMYRAGQRSGASLVSDDMAEADEAQAWIEQWIQVASEYGFSLLTFSTGATGSMNGGAEDFGDGEKILEGLARRLEELARIASESSVPLAIRPRSGHFISTIAKFERLHQWLTSDELRVAADTGQMALCQELPIGDRLSRCSSKLACVYLTTPSRNDTEASQWVCSLDLVRVSDSVNATGFQGPTIVEPLPEQDPDLDYAAKSWNSLGNSS